MGPVIATRHPLLALGWGCLVAAIPGVAAAEDLVFLPDGAPATVAAALAAAQASTERTVVVVPAGEWDFGDANLMVNHVDGLVLIGAGTTNTRWYRSVCKGGAVVRIEKSDGVRVSGITMDGCDDPSSQANAVGVHLWDSRDFRVDHCALSRHGWAGVRSNSEDLANRGVVDHCSFEQMYKTGLELGYGVAVSGRGFIQHIPFGSPSAAYIEDCTFDHTRHAVAAGGGARYVFRYNEVTGNVVSHAVDAHGLEGSATAGTEWVDVYRNVVYQPIQNVAAVRIRGGRGLVWDNQVTGYQYGVSLWHNTSQPTGPVYIWSNDWGPGVQGVGDVQGTVTYHLNAPPDYTPYPYPHPLVTDLDVRAGPDQNVIEAADGLAPAYLDASFSNVDEGSIVAYRWYDEGGLISTCARDIVTLDHGRHLLLLEVERSDGLVDYDTALVRTRVDGPVASSATWRDRWFVPIVGQGAIELDVTPQVAPMNGYVAFTGRRVVDSHADGAIIIRFNPDGLVDAYDDDGYHAENTIPYEAGVTRHLAISVDVDADRFDATVDGVPVATGYAFRTNVLSIGQLALWDAAGELTAEHLVVSGDLATPDTACVSDGGGGTAGTSADGGGSGGGGSQPGGGEGAVPGAEDTAAGCGCGLVGFDHREPPWLVAWLALLLGVAFRIGRRVEPAAS